MRKMVLAVPLALAAALALSGCDVSVKDNSSRDTGGVSSESSSGEDGGPAAAVSDEPVQQDGESGESFGKRRSAYDGVKVGSNLTYDCNDGAWSSTSSSQVVLLRGHCTDINITHRWVKVWVSQADRVNVGSGGFSAKVVANQIGDTTVADRNVEVHTGALGDVTVGGNAAWASIFTGTIGPRVTIQSDYAKIRYDEGAPSVTTTGANTDVTQN